MASSRDIYQPDADLLLEHLAAKNPKGLSLDNATQINLLIFCTLHHLPAHLKSLRLGRPELSLVFSTLSRRGLIHNYIPEMDDGAYWNQQFYDLLKGKLALRRGFGDRAGEFV